MKKEKYINPFSDKSERYAKNLDDATIAGYIEKLETILDELEVVLLNVDIASQARLYYSIGTVYSDFAKAKGISPEESLRKQLYCFRKSIDYIEAPEFSKGEYMPFVNGFKRLLYTNYGNTLSRCGRKIEAISQYKKALHIHSDFGMALGNLGRVYQDYGIIDYDDGHQDYFHHFAYSLLKNAIVCKDPNTYEEAKECFAKAISKYIPAYVEEFLQKDLKIPQFSYENIEEKLYRGWAVENSLFLNTLNDLPVAELCFASDVLQLPSMVVSIDAKPIFHGMFNQIKQEYVYARYQYYSSLQIRDKVHYADKDTHLINFADYPQYGIRIEQIKSAFKFLYGLFDKIAYFLNSYFDLGIHERDVSFNHIWLTGFGKGKNRYNYKNVLNHTENFALASLYWISRDFYDKFEDSPNPRLKRISEVRNALEHKYVKVTNGWFPERAKGEVDDLALYVTEDELLALTLELLHIVREAIICLSLCVHVEEQKKSEQNNGKLIMPMPLMEYDDEWKI
ncbi:LA2681 family HEPN domain-containing protein [Diplocloster agilis]|uniref:LA2681-like HEPN domain-containing protein n=1 Tax=Diplocloster agilis TaxID=2850323 RepID=A0A949K3I6_9FIRM|nr:LA2681 family HEPN domain-containing protein [Diplocloster agilis]MBU9739466.1 hypothetical protein [Diplocloster agilis]